MTVEIDNEVLERLIPSTHLGSNFFRQIFVDLLMGKPELEASLLENAFNELKKRHQTDEYQLELYLSSIVKVPAQFSFQAIKWANLNTNVIYQLGILGDQKHNIDMLCQRFRLSSRSTPTYHWIWEDLRYIPLLINSDFVLNFLVHLEEKYRKSGNATRRERIAEIRRAYDAAVNSKKKIERFRLTSKLSTQNTILRKKREAIEKSTPPPVTPVSYRIDPNEHRYDAAITSQNFDLSLEKKKKDYQASASIDKLKLNTYARHMVRRELEFSTNPHTLPLAHLQAIYSFLYSHASSGNLAAAQLLLSLTFGIQIPPEGISNRDLLSFFYKDKSSCYSMKIKLDVSNPDPNIPSEHRVSSGTTFELSFDQDIFKLLEDNLNTPVTFQDITECINQAKAHTQIETISPARIANALHAVIWREVGNQHLADIICGVSTKHAPALFYSSTSTNLITSVHKRAIDKISGNQATPFYFSNSLSFVGSRRTLTTEAVEAFMRKLLDKCEEASKYTEKHNNLTTWLWYTSLLLTAARPVNDFPGSFNEIDLELGIIIISDKERRDVASHRLVPICSFLKKALSLYQDYLVALKTSQSLQNPTLAYYIDEVLNGQRPIFFYIKDTELLGLTPSEVQLETDELPHYPANWPRHFCRHHLEKKAPDNLIKALFGHEGFELEMLNPLSSLPISAIFKLVPLLDKLAHKVCLKVPSILKEF